MLYTRVINLELLNLFFGFFEIQVHVDPCSADYFCPTFRIYIRRIYGKALFLSIERSRFGSVFSNLMVATRPKPAMVKTCYHSTV
jgi:hypothetical protein